MSGNKFRFSLQSVLDLREYETEKARFFLAQAVAERREQEQAVARTEQRLRELNENTPDARDDVDLHTLRQYDAFRQHARHLRDQARERLDALRQREEVARANWIEKRQSEESFQTLHDEEKRHHEQKISKAETAFLDEQAVMRYCRNDNPSSLL